MSPPKGRAAQASGSPAEPTTFAEALDALSLQRRAFVVSYLERPNATRAAIAAKYGVHTAKSQGQRLLNQDEVKTALRLGWAEAGASAEEVLARTEEVMRASLEDFFTFDRVPDRVMVQRPVRELLTELFAEIDFEEQFAQRAGLKDEALQEHQAAQAGRRRAALRMELEMERDPKASRWAPVTVVREVERLDLAKARDLGVLHLLKSKKPTRWGTAIELESREHARELIGKMHGLWKADDEGGDDTSGLEDLVRLMAERKRQRDQERSSG